MGRESVACCASKWMSWGVGWDCWRIGGSGGFQLQSGT